MQLSLVVSGIVGEFCLVVAVMLVQIEKQVPLIQRIVITNRTVGQQWLESISWSVQFKHWLLE